MIRTNPLTGLFAALFFILLSSILWSCEKGGGGCLDPEASNYDPDAEREDGSCRYDETSDSIPSTYHFEDADLTNGRVRIELLDRLLQKINQAESGILVSEQELKELYRNDGQVENGDVDIENTLDVQDRSRFEGILENIADRSGNPTSVVAGRFVSHDSIEYRPLIRYGLMKASFYHFACDERLEGLSSLDHGQPFASDPTEREAQYDEAFGLFGVPRDFSRSAYFGSEPYYSSGAWFWGEACLRTDSALGHLKGFFASFVEGRWALTNGKAEQRNEAVRRVERQWEKTLAALMIRHLKRCISAIEAGNLGARIHHWSIVHALHGGSRHNADGMISDAEHQKLREHIGTSPNKPSIQDLNEAMALLQGVYGFSNAAFQAL